MALPPLQLIETASYPSRVCGDCTKSVLDVNKFKEQIVANQEHFRESLQKEHQEYDQPRSQDDPLQIVDVTTVHCKAEPPSSPETEDEIDFDENKSKLDQTPTAIPTKVPPPASICTACNLQFACPSDLTNHERRVHQPKAAPSSLPKTTPVKRLRVKGRDQLARTSRPSQTYVCIYCRIEIGNRLEFIKHQKTHLFVCQTCDWAFSSSTALAQHWQEYQGYCGGQLAMPARKRQTPAAKPTGARVTVSLRTKRTYPIKIKKSDTIPNDK